MQRQDYFIKIADDIRFNAIEAIINMAHIGNIALRSALREDLQKELLSDYVFEPTFSWETAPQTLSELSQKGLLSPQLLDMIDYKITENNQNYKDKQFPRNRNPYKHQVKAWEALLEDKKSIVITTGTGSGKTEVFMIPILNNLVSQTTQSSKPIEGVQALFIYPLNALIASQKERLDAWTHQSQGKIRYCLYNGDTSETYKGENLKNPQEVKSRTALRESPPPLLVTNITMLEYMLIRSQDQSIIQKSQGKLKWIVLDEAHSYIGSPAAELALLLRRVMQVFDVKAENIRFVAVSATIGDDENAQQVLKKFLADLANISESQIEIITGKREIPELIKKYDDNHKKYDDFLTITDEKELYTELENNSFARKFRHKIIYDTKGNFQRAISLQNIKEKYPELDNQKILQWLDLCAKAKKDDNITFLPLRGHLHHRIMAGLWTCIDKNCSEKSEILKQTDWQFGKTYFQHRDKCDCGSPVYGLVHCQECQTEFLEAMRYDNKIIQNPPEQPDEFNIIDSDDSAEVDNIDNSSETTEQKSQNKNKANILISHISYENFNEIKLHKSDKSIGYDDENGDDWLVCHAIDSGLTQCPKCDAGRKNNPALRHLYLGGAYFTSVAMPSLLNYCDDFGDDTSELPFKGRRLITFTDSRQGTAKIATKIQQDAERQTVRGVIYHILGKETVGSSDNKDKIINDLKEIEDNYRLHPLPIFAKQIEEKKAELNKIQNAIKPISWQDLANKIANDDEFKKYIEAFNKQHVNFIGNQLADINLYREFSSRLRRYNSLETMGFVSVGYTGLDTFDIKNIPPIFTEKGKTQQDWYDFLKICLDYFFRNNKILKVHNHEYKKWLGYKFGFRLCNQQQFTEFNPVLKQRNIVRLLIHGLNLNKDDKRDQDIIKEILTTAWNFFITKKILIKEKDKEAYYLTHETFEFSYPKNRYLCPVTNKIIDTVFCGFTHFMPNIKQEESVNKYRLSDNDKITFPEYPNITDPNGLKEWLFINEPVKDLRDKKIWTNQHDYTVQKIRYYRSEEHSAQQDKKHKNEFQEGFKKGQINVLNCSTTMEMGVDIGGISMVTMNNVPPHPANYLQRAGRAGRRGETRSFAFTICKNNPHDNDVFKNPDWAFTTAMPKPFINFNSKPMIQRHVNACLLRYFLLDILKSDNSIRFNCKSFFVPENDTPSLSYEMLKRLKEDVIHNDILRNNIIQIIDNTILAKQDWQIIFDDAHRNLLDIHTDFFKDYDALQSLRETLNDDNPFKRKVDTDIKRLEKENLITYFSQHNFLPAHGFPTRIITFDTDNKNTKFQESKHEDKEDDNRYQSKGFPTRDIEVALREYAPSSDVVLNHKVYKSAGISMNWRVPANEASVKELQLFHIAWQCKHCCASGKAIESVFSGHCDYCNHEINSSHVKCYLTPTGFRTDFWSDTHNDITSTSFIPAKSVQIDASYGHESLQSLPNPAIGSYISNSKGHLFLHSAGQNDNGYLVCLQCGFACDSAEEKTFDKHYNITKDGKGKCDGAIEGSFKRQELYLGYSNTTDMIEIYLKNPVNNEYISDKVICWTLALAFRKALVKKMGIQIQDIGIHTKQKKIDNISAQGFCLYDKKSGGYGYSSYAPQIIIDLFNDAYENLHCPKNCQTVCYDCLLEHDCRDLLEFIDRKKTLEFYSEDFIKYVDLPPTEKILGDKTQFCPDQLNDIIISKRDINALYFYCGGDTQYWDIVQSALKNDLLVYSKKISQIYLILDVDNIHVLTEDLKQDLYKLIFNLDNVHLGITCDKSKIIAQCDMGNHHIISYASSQDGYKDFNENWGLTNSSPLVKSDDNQKILNFKKIDKKDLQTQSDKEIEIKDKLNGLLSDFGKKFIDLLQQKYPAKFVAKLTIDNITYSDAYLCSPWYLCLLRQILTALHKEYTISDVHIITEDFKNKGYANNQIFSNWQEAKGNYENIVSQFMKNSLKHNNVMVHLKNKNDIAHARILTIKWSDNTTTYIRFDQGMGYWACSRHYSYQDKFFDFNQTDEEQIKKLTEICDVSKIEIVNQKDNPTYLFIKQGRDMSIPILNKP